MVGCVVVAQTIYATTVDHLREYGTLKAIGASNAYVYSVIVQQAVWSALAGYGLGMAAAFGVIRLSRRAGATILVPWQLSAGMFVLTLLMCVGGSLVSVHKVTRPGSCRSISRVTRQSGTNVYNLTREFRNLPVDILRQTVK